MIDEDPLFVNLETLDNGAAMELFENAFDEALTNIRDPKTSAMAAREITLKVKIKPSEARDRAKVSIECSSKFPGAMPRDTHIFITKIKEAGESKVVASEHNPRQPRIFNEEEMRGMGGN